MAIHPPKWVYVVSAVLFVVVLVFGKARAPTAPAPTAAPAAIPAPTALDREAYIDRLSQWASREEAIKTYEELEKTAARGGATLDVLVNTIIHMMCVSEPDASIAPPNVHFPPQNCPPAFFSPQFDVQ